MRSTPAAAHAWRSPCGSGDVDPRGTSAHPLAAHPVQGKDLLLIFALDADRVDARAAQRLQQCLAVGRRRQPPAAGLGAIRLVPPHVGTHVMRGQEYDLEAARPEPTAPEVSARTRFHHHAAGEPINPEALKLRTGEPLPLGDAARGIGDGQLEHVLGQVYGNGYVVHRGSSGAGYLIGLRTQDSRGYLAREESILSDERRRGAGHTFSHSAEFLHGPSRVVVVRWVYRLHRQAVDAFVSGHEQPR